MSERPTDLRTVGTNERQQVKVTATGGEFALVDVLKFFKGEPEDAAFLQWDATAGEAQTALEGVYGAGNVRVLKGQGNATGSEPYEIEFTGALGSQPVIPIFGSAEATTFGGTTNLEGSVGETVELAKGVPPVGQVVLSAVNLGDTEAKGTITVTGKLPAGLRAEAITAVEGPNKAKERAEPVCELSSLSCTYEAGLPAFETIEVYISVFVEPGAMSGETVSASVSGAGAGTKSVSHQIEVDGTERFGIEDYSLVPEEVGGGVDTQAGSHPFQVTGTYTANSTRPFVEPNGEERAQTVALPKDIVGELPAGFVGNPTPFAQCTDAQFATVPKEAKPGEKVAYNECPAASAVGVAVVTYAGLVLVGLETTSAPIFNMTPLRGEPARFAFKPAGLIPVFMNTSVRTGSDYGIDFSFHDIIQNAWVLSTRLTFWGVPGDPRHDQQRGWLCLKELGGCSKSSGLTPPPFLVMPTSCDAPFTSTLSGDSWGSAGHPSEEAEPFSYTLPEHVDGCNRLPFDPSIIVSPDVGAASTATGLTADVHVAQRAALAPEGLAESSVKTIEVALPEGVQVNPSGGNGLEACTGNPGAQPGTPGNQVGFTGFRELNKEGEPGNQTGQFTPYLPGSSTAKAAVANREAPASVASFEPGINFCANASKVGTVRIHTPLLPNDVVGAVYLATQNQNPFGSLIAMYIVAEDPISGTLVKLPGSVSLNPGSGQLTATFQNSPELPFEDAELHFFGGERAPLATPAFCRNETPEHPGNYTTNATFTPWSGNPPATSQSHFKITTGPNGGPCPGATLPFNPSLHAGSTNINAGGFSPLTTTIARGDGEQNMSSVTLHFPPGLSGLLSNVKLCPEQQANEGTCGPESLIGETTVAAGVGSDPVSVKGGKVFITGPYNGTGGCVTGTPGCAPFGLSIVNPVKAGPFDLERDIANPAQNPACDCVVVRAKIEVNPLTAALTVATNPEGPHAIPHIIDGIPVQIQKVNVLINHLANFTFNPTNCNKMEITGSITSDENTSNAVSESFQATNCKALAFSPKFVVSTSGKTSKSQGASLTATVSEPAGSLGTQANLAKVKVELPKQLPSRLTTLQKACTNAQFELNPANCPLASKIGFATVHTPLLPVPLTGPAIFVSHGGEAFPSLTMVLQGYGVTIDLVGTTFISKSGITSTTFKAVPDQPFNSFELTLPEGKFSALAANGNLCKTKLSMPTEFVSQAGGAPLKQNTKISVTGCKPAITVTKHSVNGKTATLQVSVPSAGKLVATGKGLSKGTGKSAGAGTITVKLTLSKAEQAFLRKHHARRLKAKINLTFTPKHGSKLKTTTTVFIG